MPETSCLASARPDFGGIDFRNGAPLVGARTDPTVARRRSQSADILRMIEAEIVPHLVWSKRDRPDAAAASADTAIDDTIVSRFTRLLLDHDRSDRAAEMVASLRAAGTDRQDIVLGLFAAAARRVGQMWEADLCTFVDVALAVGTLHRMLLDGGPDDGEHRRLDSRRHALLLALPGERHRFGLSIVCEVFRSAGWTVTSESYPSAAALAALAEQTWSSVIGFTLSCRDRSGDLAAAIRLVRRHSANPRASVLVGGPVFLDQSDLAAQVGADICAQDALAALLEAERIAQAQV